MLSDHDRSFNLLSDSFGIGKLAGLTAAGACPELVAVRCFHRYSLLPKKWLSVCSMACISGLPLTLKNASPAESDITGMPSSTVRYSGKRLNIKRQRPTPPAR